MFRCFRPRSLAAPALLLTLVVGCDRGSHPPLVGNAAPGFTIRDGSRTVSLDQYRGKVVLLNFWASWCAPCIEEIPSLEQLHTSLPQVAILAVATDQDTDAYKQWIAQHPLKFENVLDPAQHATAAFPTDGVPETYVLDRQGRVLRKFVGPQDWTSAPIEKYLASL